MLVCRASETISMLFVSICLSRRFYGVYWGEHFSMVRNTRFRLMNCNWFFAIAFSHSSWGKELPFESSIPTQTVRVLKNNNEPSAGEPVAEIRHNEERIWGCVAIFLKPKAKKSRFHQ